MGCWIYSSDLEQRQAKRETSSEKRKEGKGEDKECVRRKESVQHAKQLRLPLSSAAAEAFAMRPLCQ